MASNPFDDSSKSNPFEDTRDYGSVSGHGSGFTPRKGDDADFPRLKQRVSDACYEITKQTSRLRQMSKKIGTKNDNAELREDIHELRKAAFQKVEETAELFSTVLHSFASSADRGQEIAISQLRQTFDKAAKEFGAVYEDTVNKLSSNPRPTITNSMIAADEYPSDYHKDPSGDYEAERLIQEQDTVTASYTENRAQQMEGLRDDMLQLHDIMGSIQRMVVEDGERIDGIENHVERAANDVSSGRSELGMAVRYKKCSRRLTVIIILVVLAVIAAIIIVSVIFACGVAHACSSGKK